LPDPSPSRRIGEPFIELQSVDSTNNYALEQVHAGLAQHGTVFFTHEQVAGKGQRGKTWAAEKDSSLIVSVVIDPAPLGIAQQFQLSACVAVSVCEFFSRFAGDATRIKWPNDLYWHDRKAGGILIENVIGTGKKMMDPSSIIDHPSSGWQWAIAGIGINLNQPSFPGNLKNPVSLKQITGKNHTPVDMARGVCEDLDRNFRVLASNGFSEIYQAYQHHLYKKDEKVRFKKGSRIFEAIVRSISSTGSLVVQHAIEEELAWGEAEWLLPAPSGRF
jgi:BirA family biotin operon repressor/biotin-[acetyl-CoA-carboxylase] ligase